MKCPNCGTSYTGQKTTTVIDSRPTPQNTIRRRRECPICKFRVTTYEEISFHSLPFRMPRDEEYVDCHA